MAKRVIDIYRNVRGNPVDVYAAYIEHCWIGNNTILEQGDDMHVGSTRRIAGVVIERITDAQPGIYLEYTVDSFKATLKDYRSRVEFSAVDGGKTKVRWRSEIEASNECIASLIHHTLGFTFTRILQDLRKEVEKGETQIVPEA